MNLPDLAQSLCEKIGVLGNNESRNTMILDAVTGTLRIAYNMGQRGESSRHTLPKPSSLFGRWRRKIKSVYE